MFDNCELMHSFKSKYQSLEAVTINTGVHKI